MGSGFSSFFGFNKPSRRHDRQTDRRGHRHTSRRPKPSRSNNSNNNNNRNNSNSNKRSNILRATVNNFTRRKNKNEFAWTRMTPETQKEFEKFMKVKHYANYNKPKSLSPPREEFIPIPPPPRLRPRFQHKPIPVPKVVYSPNSGPKNTSDLFEFGP